MTAVPAAPLEALIKAQAYGLGFDLVGITTTARADTADAFERWVERGYAGEMSYMTRSAGKRADARLPVPGARSAIVAAMNYGGREPSGPVARYARGDDYHDVIGERLEGLHAWLAGQLARPVPGKAYVDTGPLLERDLARRAGLGWFGKNTNLINPRIGSFVFLGVLLVDLDLVPDAPFDADRCGTCRRCLDACPTEAFADARVLDATKCISYLSIELRGAIPPALREKMGGLLYGCDICQEVCPWNETFAQPHREESFRPRATIAGKNARALALDILALDDEHFREAFKNSPMKRAKLRGLKRNAAVVLGNVGDMADAAVLTRALDDPEPLVREHAAWALDAIDSRRAATESPAPLPR